MALHLPLGAGRRRLLDLPVDASGVVQWTAAVAVGGGDDSQTLPALLVDTGSDALLTFAPDAGLAADVATYDPALSETAAALSANTFSASYGGGDLVVSGDDVADTVWLADLFGVPGTALGSATAVVAGTWPEDLDGVLGLGPGSALLAAAASANVISRRAATLVLGGASPEVVLGEYDGAQAAEEPWFTPLQSASAAYVRVDELQLLDSALPAYCRGDDGSHCLALVDSGTTYLGLPSAVWDDVAGELGADPSCSYAGTLLRCPCDGADWKTFSFWMFEAESSSQILEWVMEVRPEDYLVADGDDGDCVAMLQPQSPDDNVLVLGAPFFNAYAAYFDWEGGTVGMARLRDPVEQASGSTVVWLGAEDTLFVSVAVAIGLCLLWGCWRCYRYKDPQAPPSMQVELRRAGLRLPPAPATYASLPQASSSPSSVSSSSSSAFESAVARVVVACPRCTFEQPSLQHDVEAAGGLVQCDMCAFKWEA